MKQQVKKTKRRHTLKCEYAFLCSAMIKKDVSLKAQNTFGLDVKASIYASIGYKEQLQALWKTNLFQQSSPFILGGGSNILFQTDYHGIVLKDNFSGLKIVKETNEHVWLEVGGGENWHNVVMHAVSNEWGGIENLSLIPGTAGAAPIQNIGAYGVEVKDTFDSLLAFDMINGKEVTIKADECQFGYRDSIFKSVAKNRYFIMAVTFKLDKNPQPRIEYGDIKNTLEQWGIHKPSIADVSRAVIHIRQSKLPDPEVLGNCGSFFKNPVIGNELADKLQIQFPGIKRFAAGTDSSKIAAAWLIETAGWKGFRRGDAGVHEKQALVIVNYGTACGAELIQLARDIQNDVLSKFGIELEMEVNIR
jgi:UDP-N-acetylmuramate dehydrogenase